MQTRETPGQAYRDGGLFAAEVLVGEQVDVEHIGWTPKPLDLYLDYERNLIGCRLSHPHDAGPVTPEATAFPIHHARL
jgi:hypothetical protein